MASVAQIDTSTDQATGTEWSSSFGDLYPTAVRYTASSNWTEWRDHRGCDFIHGVPHGRPWKQFLPVVITMLSNLMARNQVGLVRERGMVKTVGITLIILSVDCQTQEVLNLQSTKASLVHLLLQQCKRIKYVGR